MKHSFDLAGKTAVITGGNGGLGLGMAETLAEMGCNVIIWGRDSDKNADALTRLKQTSESVAAFRCDVSDPEQVEKVFAQSLDLFGRVDGMFANAGWGGELKSFVDRSPKEWADMMSINLLGVNTCFQVAARHMIERAKTGDAFGRLIVTSSVASIAGAAFNEHYGASKGAVNSLTRALAVELARHGITANAILPGYSESEMTAEMFANEKFRNNVLPRIPMRRFGVPADFGGIATYLMSDLSSYHTGQSFVIDGGYHIF